MFLPVLKICRFCAEAVEIASAFPNVSMVLNHCGELAGPSSFDGEPAAEDKWRADITALGKLPNVFAKVGGCAVGPTPSEYVEPFRPANFSVVIA
jgi:predicted TIM-barrel fold metal-dependent hydrolase